MSELKNYLNIAEGFQYSVNIEYDLGKEDKIRSFIPTTASFDIIEEIMLSTHDSSTERARILIGAYGKGKSHLVLILLSLLVSKNIEAFTGLLSKIAEYNPKLHEYVLEYIASEKRILPIVIQGGNNSLSQAFLSAMQRTLDMEGLKDLMPDTHFTAAVSMINGWKEHYQETYEKLKMELNEPIVEFIDRLRGYDASAYRDFERVYPKLTSGSSFNPFIGLNVVDLYEDVTKKLKDRGYNGIYVIYDEFSKFLEADITKINSVDIRLLQDFAEKCNRSADNQMHIMLISHKDISNYIDKLPKQKVDGWRGVSERFKHVEIKNNFSQIYEIIATVIGQDKEYFDIYFENNKDRFENAVQTYEGQSIFSELTRDRLETVIYNCYPLQAVSTFILPRLSEKVAQNERTLFTFLSSKNKNTLFDFVGTSIDENTLLTPDYIYDYFEQQFKKEVYTSPIYSVWQMTSNILRKLEKENYSELGAKIVKTIALIYITDQFEKLPPTPEVIVRIYSNSGYDAATVTKTLSELQGKQYVIYQFKSNNYLRLTDKFSSKIEEVIEEYKEKLRATVTAKQVLNSYNNYEYLYPTAYNDDNEIIRYFKFSFITDEEFLAVHDWELKIEDYPGTGVVFGILLTNYAKRESVLERIRNIKCDRLIFVVPYGEIAVDNDCLEYRAVNVLKSENEGDSVLAEELEIRIEDNENILNRVVSMFVQPEMRLAEWFYEGTKQRIFRKTQISELLSEICNRLYTLTPIVKNEMVNKDIVSRNIVNAMNKVVDAILVNELRPNLGLTGSGPDISIMRTVLVNTGILKDVDTFPRLVTNGDSEDKYQNVISLITNFLKDSNNASFEKLYSLLINPEHHIGLKKGVIPIFIAVALHPIKQYVVICKNGLELELNATLLNAINEKPGDYYVFLEDWDRQKEEYIQQLEEVFADYIIAAEKEGNSFGYIVRAMQRWLASLPKYAKEMISIYKGKQIERDRIKFINALKKPEINAREFLFEGIPAVFRIPEFTPGVADNIEKTKAIFDGAVEALIKGLEDDVRRCFGKGQSDHATLNSIMRDWYENLKDATKSHLYNNGEDRILELIRNSTNDNRTFIVRLAKGIVGLRVEDWDKNSIDLFVTQISAFKKVVEEQNSKVDSEKSSAYTLSFCEQNGTVVTKSFDKCEYSDRARLLYNEVTDILDSYGQAISENEKRQILVEILEQLCR